MQAWPRARPKGHGSIVGLLQDADADEPRRFYQEFGLKLEYHRLEGREKARASLGVDLAAPTYGYQRPEASLCRPRADPRRTPRPAIKLAGTVSVTTSWPGAARKDVVILGAGFSKAISNRMPDANTLGREACRLASRKGSRTFFRRRDFSAEAPFEIWLSQLAQDLPYLSDRQNH
jgi:hypothetical protein